MPIRRDPRYPNTPTIAEAGLPGYDLTYWVGLFGPRGLPTEVQARLNAAVKTALTDPNVRNHLADMGMVVVGGTPEHLVMQIRSETEKLRAVATGIPGGIN